MKKANIPVFVAHKGCPNDCVFCNQRRITGTDGTMDAQKCEAIIKEWMGYISGEAEIAFFGGSFTGIPIGEQNALLSVASSFVDGEKITGIRLSTRPDYISDSIIENLLKYKVTAVELGAQSTDDEVLKRSHRGHDREDIIRASKLIKEAGIKLGLQMMTHLPGADDEKDIATCWDFIKMEPSEVRIYPTVVLRDTALYDMYKKGEYVPETIAEAAELVAVLTEKFESAGISVIRTGLQMSESLEASFVAGPYHPAFGEMAKSRQILNRIKKYIGENRPEAIVISCEERAKSKLYGQKRENIKALEKLCPVKVASAPFGSGILINGYKIY